MRYLRARQMIHIVIATMTLLFGQFASAGHVDLEESHPAGEICAICVVQAHLGSADVASQAIVDVEIQAPEPVDYILVFERRHATRYRLARGPPQVS